jgi:predicted enzyme related to lactoylglutathione lyase
MIKNLTIGDISIDCKESEKLCVFYSELFGWERRTMYNCPALISDNGLVILFMGCDFDYITPIWPEEPGTQQKQMHLDFLVDDISAAVDKAIKLGAKKPEMQYGGTTCVTLQDLEGHPFCLCQRQSSKSEFDLYFEQKGYGVLPIPSVNIDCPDTKKLRAFYAELTEWDRDFHWTALVTDNGLVVHFMQSDFDYIPPVWPEKPGKQQKQMHFNFQVDDLPSAVDEAIKLGATKAASQYGGDHFVTLFDPVGHPYCLCRR